MANDMFEPVLDYGKEKMMIKMMTVALAAFACCQSQCSAIELSPGNGEIVVPTNACKVVRFAARELNGVLARTFGTALPVAERPSPGKVSVILGENEWSKAAGLDPSRLGRDGFFIRAEKNRIYVVGRDDPKEDIDHLLERDKYHFQWMERATLFGVYELLERFAGVRFYFPDELGEIVPKRSAIAVPEGEFSVVPDCLIRKVSCGYFPDAAWIDGSTTTTRVNRVAQGMNWLRLRLCTTTIPCCHGQNRYRIHERFAKTHPEYFALLKDKETGQLRRDTDPERKMSYHGKQLCQSSGVWDELYLDARAYLTGQSAESRGIQSYDGSGYGWGSSCVARKYVDLMGQDGMVKCLCDNCQAVYAPDAQFATELIWGQTKKIAERLLADGVGGYVTQMAYPPYRRLPAFDLPTNILVMVAEKGPWSVQYPALWARDNAEVASWAGKLGRKVWLWTYPGKWGRHERPGIPQMTPKAYGRYFKSVKDWIFGAYAESESDRIIYNYLNHYVFAKLMWNLDTDVDALLDEHYSLMFGAAAGEIKAFYEALEDCWLNGMTGYEPATPTNLGPGTYNMPPKDMQWEKVYSPEKISAWSGLFDRALSRVAPESLEARRVAFIRQHFLEPLEAESAAYFAKNPKSTAKKK